MDAVTQRAVEEARAVREQMNRDREPTLSAAEELLETYHRRGSLLRKMYQEMADVERALSEALSRHQEQTTRVRERLLAMGFNAEELDDYSDTFGTGVHI